MNKILLFNPRSANAKHRIPNSIMQIAASVDGAYDWVIVDGNREQHPYRKITSYLDTGEYKYVGFTVMPGPQLKQAIPFAGEIKRANPGIFMIWGGYFPSNQYRTVLNSGYVDFIVNGPGDHAFPGLVAALENNTPLEKIDNLIYREEGQIIKTKKADLIEQETLPPLP